MHQYILATLIIKSICLVLTAILAVFNQHEWAITMFLAALAFKVHDAKDKP